MAIMITKKIKLYKPPVRSVKKNSKTISLELAKKLVEKGLPVAYFDNLAKNLNISTKELGEIISIDSRTLNRRKSEGKFSKVESDRIMRIYLIFQFAVKVFGDKQEATSWLKAPQFSLNRQIPLKLASTEIGGREVEDLIGRIYHGIFA